MQQNMGASEHKTFNAVDVALATAGAVVFTAEVLAGGGYFFRDEGV